MNYEIIFEDNDIIVCHKMAGLPVQTGKIGATDLVSELKNYLRKNIRLESSKTSGKSNPSGGEKNLILV